MADRDGVEVVSYRSVFEFERRIYRIDRLRLNPSGVPIRGIVYAVLIEVALLVAARLPGLGIVLRALPWPVRYAVVPGGLATLLAMVRVAGRPFHHAIRALWRFAFSPRQLYALRAAHPLGVRWSPSDLITIPDGSGSRMRRFRYRGPGVVGVATAHEQTAYRRWVPERLLGRPDVVIRAGNRAAVLSTRRLLELGGGAVLETRGEGQ